MISNPIIGADGTVYVFAGDFTLYAISPPTAGADGVLKWSFAASKLDGITVSETSPALGADGTVYVVSDKLYAIRPPKTGTSGVLKWSYHAVTKDRSAGISPTIGSDGTIFAFLGNQLCAFSPEASGKTGVVKWSYDLQPGQPEPPAIADDGTVYALGVSEDRSVLRTVGNGLFAISPATQGSKGSLKWFYDLVPLSRMSAVDEAGMVYALSFQDLHAYVVRPPSNGSRGVAAWTYPFDCNPTHSALGGDGTLYVGCSYGEIFAISKASGGGMALKWQWPNGGRGGVMSAPAIGGDGTVFVGAYDGNLHAIRPPTSGTAGVEKWSFQIQRPGGGGPWSGISSPAIGDDGTVYMGSAEGYVYAIQ